MLRIIIPLAGPSELFINAGYFYPKPLIELNGKTMIECVLQNPSLIKREHQFVFIIKGEEAVKYHLDNTLKLLSPGCEIIKLKRDTKGALCSVLMAIDKINENDSLLILNGDQIIDIDFNIVDDYWQREKVGAGIVTFKSVHPRWSYARIEKGQVVQTAEKNPISNHSIAGYYFFATASDFFAGACETIKNNVQIDGNYFISPVINQYILNNRKVIAYSISPDAYHSFYSPKMLSDFERGLQMKF